MCEERGRERGGEGGREREEEDFSFYDHPAVVVCSREAENVREIDRERGREGRETERGRRRERTGGGVFQLL